MSRWSNFSDSGWDGPEQNQPTKHIVRVTKACQNLWCLRSHLTGCLVRSFGAFNYFDFLQYSHDCNLTLCTLLETLIQTAKCQPLPHCLVIQMDNCIHENKNKYVLALFCCPSGTRNLHWGIKHYAYNIIIISKCVCSFPMYCLPWSLSCAWFRLNWASWRWGTLTNILIRPSVVCSDISRNMMLWPRLVRLSLTYTNFVFQLLNLKCLKRVNISVCTWACSHNSLTPDPIGSHTCTISNH